MALDADSLSAEKNIWMSFVLLESFSDLTKVASDFPSTTL
jgi:hypothetical protein